MIQRSPSRSARVVSPARSEPAPGSLNSWHQLTCPSRTGGHVPGDLVRRAVREDRRRRHEQPESARRTQRAELSRTWRARRCRPCGADRGRPARAVKCGAVQPAFGDDAPPLVDRELGIPVLLEPGVDLGPQRRRPTRRSPSSPQIVSVPSRSSAFSRMILRTSASSKPWSSFAKSVGSASPSPCGQSEPKRMRSTPMRSASACRSSS